jgi:hypothetical protein
MIADNMPRTRCDDDGSPAVVRREEVILLAG